MPPNMDKLDKLRLSRLVLMDRIDKSQGFDRECLEEILTLLEDTIHHIEWYRKETGGGL